MTDSQEDLESYRILPEITNWLALFMESQTKVSDFVISSIIREILENHGPALQLFARQWCESPEDCLQEVVIRIAARNEVPENWVPWVYRIVKNEAISQRRKSNRRRDHEFKAGEQRSYWFAEQTGEFDTQDVIIALESLDGAKREIITAKLWGGLTFEQISKALDCSVSTAHDRYKSGIADLKRILNRESDLGAQVSPVPSTNSVADQD